MFCSASLELKSPKQSATEITTNAIQNVEWGFLTTKTKNFLETIQII